MDDLNGLDWASSSNTNKPSKAPPMNPPSAFSYPAMRPTPSPFSSGKNTPLSTQGSGSSGFKPPASKPAQDSFSNLVNFGHGKSTANLSLRERQERLEAEKRQKQEELRKQAQANYGDGQFLDFLGQKNSAVNSRTASPALPLPAARSSASQAGGKTGSDDDLFAAFNADTKVDNASHYPPPAESASRKSTPAAGSGLDLSNPNAWGNGQGMSSGDAAEDDDPFDLKQFSSRAKSSGPSTETKDAGNDDDFLGDLAKPVEEVRRQTQTTKPSAPEPGRPIEDVDSDSSSEQQAPTRNDPFDRAVAQLVDYGFTPENARRGLTESGAGLNVQAAANWLLDDAHRQAKEKAKGKSKPAASSHGREGSPQAHTRPARGPAWMPHEEGAARRQGGASPGSGDGDLATTAAAMGTSFLKSANSLWKTGQKRVQKAVAEFQHEGDPSQPRWMQSAQAGHASDESESRRRQKATDEAMMLESGGRPERKPTRPAGEPQGRPRPDASMRTQSPGGNAVPKWQQASQPALRDPRSRINQQAVEEQSAQAYISPARRKKTTPQPPIEAKQTPPPEQDLLFGGATPSRPTQQQQQVPSRSAASSRPSSARPTPPPQRSTPQRPPRQIPACSPIVLQASTKHRTDGTAHFKRGDYAAAHASYTSSLSGIPSTHPLAIVLLCNRALTALKTGEPRQAVDDADTALGIIGPGKGEGEQVALQDGTNEKRGMKDLYGKALTRKAEALEQMEKWSDAMTVWQTCVQSGVGGPTAIAGRQRCQKALAPKPAPKSATPAARATPTAARPRPRPATTTAKSSDAVERLRAANKAAEAADGEKFALVDQVDARIAAWRDGKRDNLRALLGSLDQVLWEGSGWKKVGLHELVLANKVKIVYMKAIAKCHPDKLAQDASTEVRMVAATVFATLNESWDKFKADNGM